MNLQIIKNFIFSTKEENNHIVIILLGVKLKFINQNQINKLRIDKLEKQVDSLQQALNFFVDIEKAPKARGQLRKIQLLDNYLMKNLKKICEGLGVKFWLRGGTCLGAFRHQGFIPWDDDVDLGMMREDFDKLFEYVNSMDGEFEINYYYMRNHKTAKFKFKNSNAPVFLDIFPFDWCSYESPDVLWAKWMEDKVSLAQELKEISFERGYTHTLSKEQIDEIEKINESYKKKWCFSECKDGIISAIEQLYPRSNRLFPADMLFPMQLMKFEDEEYYVPAQLIRYLDRYFGDYMSFPTDINDRGHHYLFKDEDYKQIDILYNQLGIGEIEC